MSSKERLTVGEVARRTGIASSAVRYYESIGLLPPPERQGGWRRYEPDVVDRIGLIRASTDAGFKLDEVRVMLRAMELGEANPLAELARAKLPELEASLARLQGIVEIMRAACHCRCPSLAACAPLFACSPERR